MIRTQTLSNGLVVIVEELPHVQSASYELLIPGGILTDPDNAVGLSLVLAEITSRGAGSRDSRALSDTFDGLGVRHSEGGSQNKFVYRGSLLSDKLEPTLELVSDMVQRPTLPEGEVDPIRSVFLQEIETLRDNPARWAMTEFTDRYYPPPYSRRSIGEAEGLKRCSRELLQSEWERRYGPEGAILSIAGKVDADELFALTERIFGEWKGQCEERPKFPGFQEPQRYHIPFESAQEQIVLAYPSERFGGEHYYAAKVANGVLSGGMFGRLFIEVREKRGLCYSVYSRHAATSDYGLCYVYAGTTPDRADETLEVIIDQLVHLAGSVEDSELERAKANLLASIVIGEESAASRCSSNAADWWLIGRVRSLDEIRDSIEEIQASNIEKYCNEFAATNYSVLTLGSRDLIGEKGE